MWTATTVDAAPALETKNGGVPALEIEGGCVRVDPSIMPYGSSRVTGSGDSGDVDDNPLKSTLLPNDVMDRYLERAKKLRQS